MTTVHYVPPATGFRVEMGGELAALSSLGLLAAVVDPAAACPPAVRERRGLKNPGGEVLFWEECRRGLAAYSGALVGFNFGGSLAAFHAVKQPVRALVVAGSVPRLSSFWLQSRHPAATAARAGGGIDPQFEMLTRPLDLTESVRRLAIPVLLQFGRKDEWIDEAQVAELAALRPAGCEIRWYNDDHDMASAACVKDRADFLCRWAFPSS